MILKTHRHVAEAVFRLRNVLRDVLLRNTGMCEIRMRPTAGPRAIRLMSLQMYVRTVSGAAVGGRGEWEAVESSPENRPERSHWRAREGGKGLKMEGAETEWCGWRGQGSAPHFARPHLSLYGAPCYRRTQIWGLSQPSIEKVSARCNQRCPDCCWLRHSFFFFGCITDMIWRTFYESWQWTRRCAPVCSVAPVSDILHFNLRICAVYFDSTGDVEYFYFQIEVVDTSCF